MNGGDHDGGLLGHADQTENAMEEGGHADHPADAHLGHADEGDVGEGHADHPTVPGYGDEIEVGHDGQVGEGQLSVTPHGHADDDDHAK